MTKFQKLKIIFLLSTFYFLFSASFTLAANLFFETKGQDFKQGEEFLASIFLNTGGESINAAEGRIVFPGELLEVKEIRDGNSIINFWVEKPKLEQSGVITFSGIIPGGYQETKGFVFSVVFRAKASGNGAVEIRDAKVLQNDGKGTPAKTAISNFQFSISEDVPSSKFQVPSFRDIDPPEYFTPEIANDPNIFNSQWFLVFATQDKGSGIDYYEVCEGKRKCVIAESPYLLQNQNLDREIVVKATDKSGNERIAAIPAQRPAAWYKDYAIFVILIIAAAAYLIWKILWKKRRK